MKINKLILALFIVGCGDGFKIDKSTTNINNTTITGSYNVNKTTCDFKSEKIFNSDGSVQGCVLNVVCDGAVRPDEFVALNDKDFNAKCESPEESLPTQDLVDEVSDAQDALNDGVL